MTERFKFGPYTPPIILSFIIIMKGFLYYYKQSFMGKKAKKLHFTLDGDTLSWSDKEGIILNLGLVNKSYAYIF